MQEQRECPYDMCKHIPPIAPETSPTPQNSHFYELINSLLAYTGLTKESELCNRERPDFL